MTLVVFLVMGAVVFVGVVLGFLVRTPALPPPLPSATNQLGHCSAEDIAWLRNVAKKSDGEIIASCDPPAQSANSPGLKKIDGLPTKAGAAPTPERICTAAESAGIPLEAKWGFDKVMRQYLCTGEVKFGDPAPVTNLIAGNTFTAASDMQDRVQYIEVVLELFNSASRQDGMKRLLTWLPTFFTSAGLEQPRGLTDAVTAGKSVKVQMPYGTVDLQHQPVSQATHKVEVFFITIDLK